MAILLGSCTHGIISPNSVPGYAGMRISQPKAGIVLHTADPIINYTLRLCSSQRLSAPGELPRRESGQLFFLLSSSSSVFLRDYRLLILPCYLQSRLPYITITSTNVMGSSSELDTDTSLPDGAWDSHVHIADEVSNQLDNHTPEKERKRKMHRASFNIQSPIHVLQDKFPYHPSHPYRPKKADLDDLLTFQQTQGITHSCLVAFSVYHTDNSILLDALRRLNINGSRGRAVACVDSQTVTDTELQDLHNAGVRGIRLNFRTSSIRLDDDDDAAATGDGAVRTTAAAAATAAAADATAACLHVPLRTRACASAATHANASAAAGADAAEAGCRNYWRCCCARC